MNQDKYIISIGAGKNQHPIIKSARKLGFKVIGVDQNSKAQGMIDCDLRLIESTREYRKIYRKLLEYPLDGKIHGVLSRSFGSAGKTAAYLSQKFGLRGNPFENYARFIDKQVMKEILKEKKIEIPEGKKITNWDKLPSPLQWPLPWIAKKKISHAKQGNYFISDLSDVEKFFDNEKPEDFILERFIANSKEVTVIGLVSFSKFYLVEITEKITSGPPNFVELEHRSVVNLNEETVKEIIEMNQNAVEALEIHFGPVVSEILVTSGNDTRDHLRKGKRGKTEPGDNENLTSQRLVLIEIVPEFGGEYLAEAVALRKPGYNIFEEAIRVITMENFNSPPNFFLAGKEFFSIQFLTAEDDLLKGMQDTLDKKPIRNGFLKKIYLPKKKAGGLILEDIFVKVNDLVGPASDNSKRLGYFAIKGKNADDTLKKAQAYRKGFCFIVIKKRES